MIKYSSFDIILFLPRSFVLYSIIFRLHIPSRKNAIIESSAEKAMPRGSRNGRLYAAAENGTATAVQQGIYRVKSPESTKKPSSRTALCGGEGGIRTHVACYRQLDFELESLSGL